MVQHGGSLPAYYTSVCGAICYGTATFASPWGEKNDTDGQNDLLVPLYEQENCQLYCGMLTVPTMGPEFTKAAVAADFRGQAHGKVIYGRVDFQ